MIPALQDCLWDILESEACERYFIGDAEKPAFLLLSKHNLLTHNSYELFMTHVSRLGKYGTRKKAVEKLDMMLSTATKKIHVFRQTKRGIASFSKKVLYATIEPSLPKKEERRRK